ncbi:MAG: inositol 2-dehydrogenase [Lachnospiraceae bacterium]|jgi:myo-inositol 2-dehydrogenase/D-chiro-inositol 1-dehydrogenase|nr:inositol 2-dehydrogenase [Lachnospiraceae bacterium]
MSRLKVGVVGVGRIGRLHIENIVSQVKELQVVAASDVAEAIGPQRAWLEETGVKHIYTDYRDLIADQEVEAVIVAVPTPLHGPVSIGAAKAGKHVFCEKPLDKNIEGSLAIVKACEEAGVKLQVGFNRRFDHNFKQVYDYVQAGAVGTPQIIKITSRDPQAPAISYIKTSGGLFMDMMIHDFDMVRFLAGCDCEEIYASGAVLVDPQIGEAGDIDTAVVTMKMSNGALAVIDNSRQAVYGYDQRAEVFGSKGQAASKNDRPSTVELSTADGESTDKIRYFFLDRYTQAFIDEFKGFAKAVAEDALPLVDGTDGVEALRMAYAAGESLKSGLPVKIVR